MTETGLKLSQTSLTIFLRFFEKEEELLKAPILILANKQDLENVMTPDEITEILNLTKIKERDWAIYKVSALKDFGLDEAITWLSKTVSEKK